LQALQMLRICLFGLAKRQLPFTLSAMGAKFIGFLETIDKMVLKFNNVVKEIMCP
jgi:hypothetical protein